MDYEPLQIKDSERKTYGGPPGWFAFAAIGVAAMTIAFAACAGSMLF